MRFSELEGARVGVWGAGREITSFARQLKARLSAAEVAAIVFDGAPPAGAASALGFPAAEVVGAERAQEVLARCDVVVRSPGVSIHRPEMDALRAAGVPVTTATSLWLAQTGGAGVLGITGTKGKSTTAALASHLARAAGVAVRLAGNIGDPALDLLDGPGADLTVLELSSYQIADLAVGPEAVLLTNLYREHTDWHGSEDVYRAEKTRILALPGVRTRIVNGRDDALLAASDGMDRVLYGVPGGWDATPRGIERSGELVLAARELPLAGDHNALNLSGALAGLEALSVAPPDVREALRDFRALPHRLELVLDAAGVQWIDDSISTTPESAIAAIESFRGRPLVLIAGGQDRGQDHGALACALAAAGASVVGVPSTGERLIADARRAGIEPSRAMLAADLRDAVAQAAALAGAGAVVLLSPAAPSYDNYENFEARGRLFRELVAAL